MTITVSGEKKEVKDGLTLPELIEQENVDMPEYVTVSINDEFVVLVRSSFKIYTKFGFNTKLFVDS